MRRFTIVLAAAVVAMAGVQARAGSVRGRVETFRDVLGAACEGVSAVQPFVMHDPQAPGAATHGAYRIWYTCFGPGNWNSADNWIEHAWSRDGASFESGVPVKTADPRGQVLRGYLRTGWPVVAKEGGQYRLYHFRYHYKPPIHGEWAGCVEIASGSDDGLTFTKHIEHAMDPLYRPQGWDNYVVKPGCLLKEDGRWVMYYQATGDPYAGEKGDWTGRAVSDDGLTWPRCEGPSRQRAVAQGDASWRGGDRPSVVRRGPGEYWMFHGQGAFATSTDGVNWTPGKPVLTAEALGKVLGTPVSYLGGFFHFRDPTGTEYLYFAYGCAGKSIRIGRVELVVEDSPGGLAVELTDGQSVRGAADSQALALTTKYGAVHVPVRQVRALTFTERTAGGESWREAQVETLDGDRLTGSLKTESLELTTPYGRLSIPMKAVKRMGVSGE